MPHPILLKYRTKTAACISTADPVPLCLVSISQLLGADCVSEPTPDIYKFCKYVHINVALFNAVCPYRQRSYPIYLKHSDAQHNASILEYQVLLL